MRPIVDELEEQYMDLVDFFSLNALDGGQGQTAFAAYGLRGHPAIVLVQTDGQVSDVLSGVVAGEDLERAIQALFFSEEGMSQTEPFQL